MPYSGINDKDLPDDVKGMSDDKKKVWVETFNKSYENCDEDKVICEEEASKAAYAAAKNAGKKTKANIFEQLGRAIVDTVQSVFSTSQERNMIDIPAIFYLVSDAVSIFGGYLIDVYYDQGNLFALATKEGKLYRYNVRIEDDGVVATEDGVEIPINQSEERSRISVIKQSGGKYRWLVIACSSVIDRDGEIDSTELFDDFIRRINSKEAEYPYLTFFHIKEKMRMGMADYIARDRNVLIVSGLFDDSKLAKLTREGLEKEPNYWGISISYEAKKAPEMEIISDGIKVPVYRSGVLEELSILPEERAAAWFTAVNKPVEVNRMKDEIMKALGKLIGDENAEEFGELVDGVNERIINEKMIVRSEAGTNSNLDDKDKNVDDKPVDKNRDIDNEADELIIDDEMMRILINQVLSSDVVTKLSATVETLAESVEKLARSINETEESVNDTAKRLEVLEREDEQKKKDWQDDLPAKRKIVVTHRARNERLESSVEVDGEEVDYGQVAANTLHNFALK